MNIRSEQFEAKCQGLWLPIELLTDEQLTLEDTAVLVCISALDSAEKHCTASNEYIAGCFGMSPNKASQIISKLIKLNYLQRVSFDGRTRVLRSLLKQRVSDIDNRNNELQRNKSDSSAEKV